VLRAERGFGRKAETEGTPKESGFVKEVVRAFEAGREGFGGSAIFVSMWKP
jgi:hypothetical protein